MNPTNTLSTEERYKFERDGFHVLKSLFTEKEAEDWRQLVREALNFDVKLLKKASAGTWTLADGVTKHPAFWNIIFNTKLLATIRQLVGDDIRYTQHSDLHINLPGGRWHRDNAYRSFSQGPDWEENKIPYRVVRVAVYLSDYSSSGSALHLLPGSHHTEHTINRLEYVLWNKIRSYLRKYGLGNSLPHHFFSASVHTLKTRPGDCIIFDQRLMHAGGRLLGNNSKYSVFLSFGLNNEHSKNHRKFFLRRPTYAKEIPNELRSRLSEQKLLLE